MKDLLNEANRRDNERKIGIFNMIIANELVFILCNN